MLATHCGDLDHQVRTSSRLREAAGAAIIVGNAVNAGTPYGDAKAVRLESLLKLADLKVTHPGCEAGP